VGSGSELLEGILTLMSDPDDLMKRGEKGRKMVIANTGAAEKYAEMVRTHIVKGSALDICHFNAVMSNVKG
jgi:hypothetical protein